MGINNFRGDRRPFYRTPDGEEVPAVFVIGGFVSLSSGIDNNEQILLVDPDTSSLVMMEWEHHQVHEGQMFHAEHSFGTVANNNNADMRLLTGAKEAHVVFFIGHGGQCLFYLYETPNQSGGTAVPVVNMNRNSAHVAGVTVFHGPAVVGVGSTPLVNGRLLSGGTSPNSRVGGGIRTGTEYEFKPATEYLMRVNNNSGAGIGISIGAEFYEVTP